MLMHAARYADDVDVFRQSLRFVKYLLSEEDTHRICKKRDAEGRTLLHHAAETRSDEMLEKVTYDACSILART